MSELVQLHLKAEMHAEAEEEKFLSLLNANKKVIFDWGNDTLWVIENDDETKPENCHSITGERLYELTGITLPNSAETVVLLLKHGMDVEVRGAENVFKTKDELDQFMEEAKKLALE